jgi:hypothetical protein
MPAPALELHHRQPDDLNPTTGEGGRASGKSHHHGFGCCGDAPLRPRMVRDQTWEDALSAGRRERIALQQGRGGQSWLT